MFVIETPYFSLQKTYDSGQVFRWIRLSDDKYIIPYKDKALKVEQRKERLIMSCSEDDFYNIWFDYFDLSTDYMHINFEAKRMGEHMKICSVRGNGIHILKQDLFEMIVTFMLATASNIQTIKSRLNLICIACGKKRVQSMREAGKVTWYEFPTPQEVVEHESAIGSLGLERKEHIISIANDIIDGWLDLEDLQQMSYEDAREYLMQFDGIGPKVADCICLYGLHHMQSFPIDTHINQVLEREFDCDYETFKEWYLDGKEDYTGIIQQYLFYNEINKPKENIKWA